MDRTELLNQTEEHLHFLCGTISDRRVGGEGNRKATAYVKEHFTAAGCRGIQDAVLSLPMGII